MIILMIITIIITIINMTMMISMKSHLFNASSLDPHQFQWLVRVSKLLNLSWGDHHDGDTGHNDDDAAADDDGKNIKLDQNIWLHKKEPTVIRSGSVATSLPLESQTLIGSNKCRQKTPKSLISIFKPKYSFTKKPLKFNS